MKIPTLNFISQDNFESIRLEFESKINSSGEKLDSFCTLIEKSFENVTIECDADSTSIKFIAESDKHSMNVNNICIINLYLFI